VSDPEGYGDRDERRTKFDSLIGWCGENAPDLDDRAAVPVSAVLLVEWMDEKGEKWMTRLEGPEMTSWQVRGLLHEALYFWPDGSSDDG
jgi:hypothetical protein